MALALPGVQYHSFRFRLDEDEVLQELVLRLLCNDWERLRSWNRQSSLETWLGVVAFNLCSNMAKSQQARAKKVVPMLDFDLDDHSRGIDELVRAVDLKLDCHNLLEAVGRLPEVQGYVLLQRHYFGRRPEDLAQELSKSIGNINVICFRAITALRELLGGSP